MDPILNTGITSLDSLVEHQILTSGIDRTLRLWKVDEETQMLFQGHKASIDCAALLHAESFGGWRHGLVDGGVACSGRGVRVW